MIVELITSGHIAAYPRKGTITSKCFLFVVSHHIAAYPRKGAKNSASKDAEFFFYKT